MVDTIRRELRELEVHVIDVSTSRSHDRKRVFSVPTWVLDGRTLSLGNPRMEELRRAIETSFARQEKR